MEMLQKLPDRQLLEELSMTFQTLLEVDREIVDQFQKTSSNRTVFRNCTPRSSNKWESKTSTTMEDRAQKSMQIVPKSIIRDNMNK